MQARWIVLLAVGTAAWGQRVQFKRQTVRQVEGVEFRGGVFVSEAHKEPALYAWGTQLRSFRMPRARTRVLMEKARYGPGGCAADINGDGAQDLVLHKQDARGGLGEMVWLASPDWTETSIDTGADFRDCVATMYFGKRGILVLHRQAQVRFYEIPARPGLRWPYREIYSIYTPSAQGGLLRGDVNGDGHADIYAGNYWIESPQVADASWRLYAINNWWDDPHSALVRLALAKPLDTPFPVLVAAQTEAAPARVSIFEKPRDPTQMWTEIKVEAIPPIRKAEALTTADFNGDLRPDVAIGENAGDGSRLLIYWGLGGGRYQGTRIDLTSGLAGLWTTDFDGDGDLDLVGLGRDSVTTWRNQRLR